MEYRVAVVIMPKNTTDLAGTIVFGETIKDLGTILCMVTPEHDVIPFADNDQPKIDRRINNIITHGAGTIQENEYINDEPELPKFDLSGDPAIMIVKKGGHSFVHNDIEKYIDALNLIEQDLEPYVMSTKYQNVDRIQMPYMTDELVFWRYKENRDGVNKYHSLDEQIRYLIDILTKEYTADTDRFLKVFNTFYACGCDPKVQSWHKTNLDQINKDDKLIRLFGELSSRRHNIENVAETLESLSDDITEGCYIQRLDLDRGSDKYVNLKFYSNFKFPRIRGIVLGYDGQNLAAARFDCTSSSGIPLYVAVDTWIGNRLNSPILIAPADSSYTLTADTRYKYFLITDIPECVYEVLDDNRLTEEEAKGIPLTTQFNGDFIKNTRDHLIYNIGEDSVVAQEISIVGSLEENLLEAYMTSYRVSHRLPQLIDDIDDELMYIIGTIENISSSQLISFKIYDNYNNGNTILSDTITYSAYRAMAGGYAFRYPKVYEHGIDYNVEAKFVKSDGAMVQNTQVYNIRTTIPRSDKAMVLTADLETDRRNVHIKKADNTAYPKGTLIKARITNGDGSTIFNKTIVIDDNMLGLGYGILDASLELRGNVHIDIEVKEPNKFQSLIQRVDIDMDNILPRAYYNISNIEMERDDIYLDRNKFTRALIQDNTYYNGAWYDSLGKYYSENPSNIRLLYNCGAPKVEVSIKIKDIPSMEDLEWTKTFTREMSEVNNTGIRRNTSTVLDVDNNTLPYSIYNDKILKFNNYSPASIAEFRNTIDDMIVAMGGRYEFTVKSYDPFGTLRESATYLSDKIIDNPVVTNAIDINDVFDTLFEYEATEDNMITNLKLNVGTKYANAEFILMIETEDNKPNIDTKLYNFYIDENGLVTKTNNINYNNLERNGNKYVLFTKDDVENIASKQNISLWIRPRNTDNALFTDWYGSELNNTFFRMDKDIVRAVPKEPGITRLHARANITDVIDYIDDEYIEVNFTHNIARVKQSEYRLKIELKDSDGVVLFTEEKPVPEWTTAENKHRFSGVKYNKDVNKFIIDATMIYVPDNDNYTSVNKAKNTSVTVERTKQPWFKNTGLGRLPLTNLDIRMAEGTSYPLDTKFWVRIENDNDELLFEHNGSIDAVDIINGYYRIYISKRPEGLFTLSVIAKELGKYQSLIYRTSAEFVVEPLKYGSVYYDGTKELTVFRYSPGKVLDPEVIDYLAKITRRTEPGRAITKVIVRKADSDGMHLDANYSSLEELKTAVIPDNVSVLLELEPIPAGEYRYINAMFNGSHAGKIVCRGGAVSSTDWNDWYNDYRFIYDLRVLEKGFDITEHNPADDTVVATKHMNEIADIFNASFDLTKTKWLKIDGVKPREHFKNIGLKINDTNSADFDSQTKRLAEYNETTGVFTYKRPNNRDCTKEDFDNFISMVERITVINNNVTHMLTSISDKDGHLVWSIDDPYNYNDWIHGDFDDKELTINVTSTTRIMFNVNFVFSQNPDMNYSKSLMLRKSIGSSLSGPEIDELFKDFVAKYCDIQATSGPRILSNIRGGYRVKIYYIDEHNVKKSVGDNYKYDCLFNRRTGKTVAEVYSEIYTSKPAISNFTIEERLYNIEVDLSADDIINVNPNLRNHTIVSLRVNNAVFSGTSGFFKDRSKVYVFNNGNMTPITSTSDNYRNAYVYIPNGSSLFNMFDISKAVADTGFNTKSYDIAWNGESYNNAEKNWNNEYYKRPIAYVDTSIKVLEISYSDAVRAPVIQNIKFTRDYGEPVRVFRGFNNYTYTVFPTQILDDSKQYREHIARTIMNTPVLKNAIVSKFTNSVAGRHPDDWNVDNIWTLLEYPTTIPNFINMNIEFEFDRDYTDTVGKSYYPGREMTVEYMNNSVINTLGTCIGIMRNHPYLPIVGTSHMSVISERSNNYIENRGIYNNTIRVNDETLRVSKELFYNSNELNVTNVDYITVADYVVAYNLYYKSLLLDKSEQNKDETIVPYLPPAVNDGWYGIDELVYRSKAIKDHRGYRNLDNGYDFYVIFAIALKIRSNVLSIHPLNYVLAMNSDKALEIRRNRDVTANLLSNRLAIREGYVTLNGRKVALELEYSANGGDIYDLNHSLQLVINTQIDINLLRYQDKNLAGRSFVADEHNQVQNTMNKRMNAIIAEPTSYTYIEGQGGHKTYNLYQFNNQFEYRDMNGDTVDRFSTYSANVHTLNAFKTHTSSEPNDYTQMGILINDIDLAAKIDPATISNNGVDQIYSMPNGIFFPLFDDGDSTQDRNRSNACKDGKELELVVRIEDSYIDNDFFGTENILKMNYALTNPPNILYDSTEEAEVLKFSIDDNTVPAERGDLHLSGLSRIELIPRKIKDVNINDLNIVSAINSEKVSTVLTSLTTHNNDYDIKYEQYVPLLGLADVNGDTGYINARLTNKKPTDYIKTHKDEAISYYPVRGMMQCIANNSFNNDYKKDGFMILEVRIGAICNIGINNYEYKYWIVLNTKKMQPDLNRYNNTEGSWSNDLIFGVLAKEDSPFENEFGPGQIFRGNITNINSKYKTDINTYVIKFKRTKLKNNKMQEYWQYIPTGIDGHPIDRFNNMHPKLCLYEYLNETHSGFYWNQNMDWNTDDGFDPSRFRSEPIRSEEELNEGSFWGFPVYFPIDDSGKAVWSRKWFRRFTFVLREPDTKTATYESSTYSLARLLKYNLNYYGFNQASHALRIMGTSADILVYLVSAYKNWCHMDGYIDARNRARLPLIVDASKYKAFPYDIYSWMRYRFNIHYRSGSRNYYYWGAYIRQLQYMFGGVYRNKSLEQVKKMMAYYIDLMLITLPPDEYELYAVMRLVQMNRAGLPSNIFTGAKFEEFWNKYIDFARKQTDDNTEVGRKYKHELYLEAFDKVKEDNMWRARSVSTTRTESGGTDIINDWLDNLDGYDRSAGDIYGTRTIQLSADLDLPLNPTGNKPTILAKTKVGKLVRLLVSSSPLHVLYKTVDYVKPSLVTIIQPSNGLLETYTTIIDIEFPTEDSVGVIGNWVDGYDLSLPTYIRWNDTDYISEDEFNKKAVAAKITNNIVIGWYKPGVDPAFNQYKKSAKKSGLYLKVYSMFTQMTDQNTVNKSEEFYYPLFRTIGEHVERKLDLLYNEEVLHARTTGSNEIILQNGASFYPNPLLDYTLSVLDNKSKSKILRIY